MEPLDALRTRGCNALPRGRVASNGDHVNAWVSRECRADVRAWPRDDIQNSWRQDLLRQRAEHQRADRCACRRLEHNRVASGERRTNLPARHQKWIVPWCDGGDHANWIASNHARSPWKVLGDRLPLHVARGACEVAQVVNDRINFNAHGADWLPGIFRLRGDECALL